MLVSCINLRKIIVSSSFQVDWMFVSDDIFRFFSGRQVARFDTFGVIEINLKSQS